MEFDDVTSPLWTDENGCGIVRPRPDDIPGCEGEVLSRRRRRVGGSPSAVRTASKDGQANDGI